MISKYEFKPLATDKANALLEELYGEKFDKGEYEISPATDKPLSLADIYHFYEASYEKERRKII